jgi:hypothetical protein
MDCLGADRYTRHEGPSKADREGEKRFYDSTNLIPTIQNIISFGLTAAAGRRPQIRKRPMVSEISIERALLNVSPRLRLYMPILPLMFSIIFERAFREFGIESRLLTIPIAGRTLPTHCVVALHLSQGNRRSVHLREIFSSST